MRLDWCGEGGEAVAADVGGAASAQSSNASVGVQRSLPLGEGWARWVAPGGALAIHDVFPDPADPNARPNSPAGASTTRSSTTGTSHRPFARSTPVGLPKPSRVQTSCRIADDWRVVEASPSATLAATTLRDQATASSNFIQPLPLWSASSTCVRPPSRTSFGTSLSSVVVVTVFVSRPAIAVSILKTEPGS